MTHPIGGRSFDPSARFAFNRSYIKHIDWYVNNDNANITLSANVFTIYSVAFPSIIQYVELSPIWVPWSSNAYTLDHLVLYYWYVILPSPTEIPNGVLTIRYRWDNTKGMVIQLQKELPDTHVYFNLANTPLPYWLDPVPG